MMKILSILGIIMSTALFSQQRSIDLYIFAGQSNAQGYRSEGKYYPTDRNNVDKDIKFNWSVDGSYTSNGWATLGAQTGMFTEGYFGPEITFAREMKQSTNELAVIKYTKPGTGLYIDWKKLGEGGIFDRMIQKVNLGVRQLENQGYTVNFKGFTWIQGESDASEVYANEYEERLNELIDYVRNNIAHKTDLPIVVGVDEQHPGLIRNPKVVEVQKKIASEDSNISFTSMLGLPKYDATHATSPGVIVQGKRIYDAYQCLNNSEEECEEVDRSYMISSPGASVSYERYAWSQSFVTGDKGILRELFFNSATASNTSFTLTVRKGSDCNGQVLSTQKISSIVNGKNRVTLLNPIQVKANETYYFSVVSDENVYWKVRYSSSSTIPGNLYTYRYGGKTACDYNFTNYDWNFSVFIEKVVLLNSILSNEEYTINSEGTTISYNRYAWNQSFVPSKVGSLSEISFNSATASSTSFTFLVRKGSDCNGQILHTQKLSSIRNGENKVVLSKALSLDANETYYFSVISDQNVSWKIRFNNSSNVQGNLYTYRYGGKTACDYNFANYDWNFTVLIKEVANSSSRKKEIVLSNENYEVKIGPNPIVRGGDLFISGDKNNPFTKEVKVQIYNFNSKLVYNKIYQTVSNNRILVPITNLKEGLYIVNVFYNNEVIRKKLQVK